MALVLGGLALFVALGALWMAADIQRTLSNKNSAMLKAHIKPLREAVTEDRAAQAALQKQAVTDRNIIEALNEKVKYLEDSINGIEGDLKKLQQPVRAKAGPAQSNGKGAATGTNG